MRRTSISIENLERRQLLSGMSGTVYEDRNNNGGYASPDHPLGGVTVYIDANTNGVFDAGEASTVSSNVLGPSWGSFSIGGLAAGTYQVRVVAPANHVQTAPANNQPLIVTFSDPRFSTIGLAIGLRDTTQSSSIAGTAYADDDRDGFRDQGEAGIANVTIYNDKDDNGTLDAGEESTLTSSTGQWTLAVLNPNYTATFKIRAVAPAGMVLTSLQSTSGAFVKTMDADTGTLSTNVFGFAPLPDVTPPQVTGAAIELNARPHVIRFDLSEPLGTAPWQLSLLFSVKRVADVNGPTNVSMQPGSFTLSTETPGVLRFTANTSVIADGLLPDGVYRATIPGGYLKDAAGNTNPSSYTFEFSVLRGDANGDRVVNFDDLVVLAQNYNKTGQTVAQGNFDFSADGNVNFDDLALLAQRYNMKLQTPTAFAAAPLPEKETTTTKKKSPSIRQSVLD